MTNDKIIDVLILGAGLSGIDAAYRLQTECPQKTYLIIEARARVGGTWDLFKYPGIRSDSDVETLGFPFKPWTHEKSIAGGDAIRQYIEETAKEFAIDQHIQFGWRSIAANWSTSGGLWIVTCINSENQTREVRCRFLYSCTGYYNYSEGYMPAYPHFERFKGTVLHPQFWPREFDPAGKKIVVIGSGATAVTLLPSLAEKAERVTMLQRSPTYIASRPAIDPVSQKIKSIFPKAVAHKMIRLKNILYGFSVYKFSKKYPDKVRGLLMAMAKRQLPDEIDVTKDFNPRYQPWDQRLCLAPDGDFFKAFKNGKAFVETGEIASFEEGGIVLRSGKLLVADVIVSATGLKLQLGGGTKLSKDTVPFHLSEHFNYKGAMISDLPNFAMAIGYTNASWTLKCDLTARYVCRLLNYMDKRDYDVVSPIVRNQNQKIEPLLDLTSGYIQRGAPLLPKQGDKKPWRMHQNYFRDWLELEWGRINDASLVFSKGKR